MQLNFFGGTEPLKITKPIRLIELFGGIGCQAQALENIGAEFEHYRLCEWDKYAIKSYNAVYGTSFARSDIRKWKSSKLGICDTDKFDYIMTYSFPCQALSVAGQRSGFTKGSRTTSALVWEVERLLNGCKELPRILLMENVTQVHGFKNRKDFRMWREFLESKGYKNYYQDLNAKNYGVAQNRNRCLMVSCLGDYYYDFPQGFKLEKRLKDYLETEVDKKYYLSKKQIENFRTSKYVQNTRRLQEKEVCDTLCARDYKDPKCVEVKEPTIIEDFYANREAREYADTCPTLRSDRSGLKVKEPIVYDDYNKRIRQDQNTIGTITPNVGVTTPKNSYKLIEQGEVGYRIRKLTPRECWRLMGWQDDKFDKAQAVNSNSQLYKQAGNGIVIQVLEQIFKELL